MQQNNSYDYLFKLVLVGDEGVGKSCLYFQYFKNKFLEETISGCEFDLKLVNIDDQIIKLLNWHTAGQKSQLNQTRLLCKASAAILLIYSVINRESFDNIPTWLEEVLVAGSPSQIIILVGNKTDLEGERQVSFKEGQQFACNHGLHFFETSAKNDKTVEDLYIHTAQLILNKIIAGEINLNDQYTGVKMGTLKQENYSQNPDNQDG